MSKIFNVRLPNASPDYSPEQFNQLVRSLEQVILQLNSTYTSTSDQNQSGAQSWFTVPTGAGGGFAGNIRGFQNSSGITLPHAMFMSTVDQANAGITSENLVKYDLQVTANSIWIENDTEIHCAYPGEYLVTFSLQFTNRGNAAQEFEVWAKNTGTNFDYSNTRYDIAPRKSVSVWSHQVAVISGIFTVNDPNTEYLEIAWWSDGTDVFLENYPVGTSPDRPAIPSVILTINQVSAI